MIKQPAQCKNCCLVAFFIEKRSIVSILQQLLLIQLPAPGSVFPEPDIAQVNLVVKSKVQLRPPAFFACLPTTP